MPGDIEWTLAKGSEKISTRFFSVTVDGRIASLYDVPLPRVRVEVREGGTCISQTVSASYGLDEGTGVVNLRLAGGDAAESGPRVIEPNTVALMITQDPTADRVSVHLIDTNTDAELAKLDGVEVAISI